MENTENMENMKNKCCACVGYGFVPVQELECTYEPCKALEQGSLFPELDLNICEYGKICKGKGGIG